MTELAAPLRCAACGRILKRAAVEVTVDSRKLSLGPTCARARKLLAPVRHRVCTGMRARRQRPTPQMPLEFA